MDAARIAELAGVSVELAQECLDKRPGRPEVALALAKVKREDLRLKEEARRRVAERDPDALAMMGQAQAIASKLPTMIKTLSAEIPRGYTSPGAVACDCCGRYLPLNRDGFCSECTKRGSRKWNKGRSKFNALPRRS